jgi:hypothetical protein
MLLLTPESRRWRRLTSAALLVLAASYVWYARLDDPHGGSALGIAYGVAAAVLLLVLLFLGVRKRWHTSRLGRLESWCQSHVYLGVLAVGIVLCHSGFRFGDRVAVGALLVLVAVALSGLVGAVLYTAVPLLLTGVETNLAPEEMSRQVNQLGGAMARLAAGRSPALEEIARGLLGEERPGRLAGWRLLLRPPRAPGPGRGGEPTQGAWARWLPEVPPAEQPELQQLLVLARQRRELHQALVRQQRYRNLLAVWLYLHVPLSVLLLLALAAHLWGALRYAL